MRWLLQSLLLLLVCFTVQAQDVGQLYTVSDLDQVAQISRPKVTGAWQEDFLSRLTLNERSRAGQVTLDLPLVGVHRHPLDFYSDAKSRRVTLPIASVEFIYDLMVASAYYLARGCDTGLISDYFGVLRYRPGEISGSPLGALGAPPDAVKDHFVDDVAQKALSSIVFFVMAHEYAHVMYQHAGYSLITVQTAQQQETEADAFALEVMRRIAVPPVALAQFFLIVSRLEVCRADCATDDEYEVYLRQGATHPMSGQRILAVAQAIEDGKAAFARAYTDPTVGERRLEIAVQELRVIGREIDDPKMRNLLRQRALTIDVAALRSGCKR
jgi:hypothetical protein